MSVGASAEFLSMKYDTNKGESFYSGLSDLEIVFKDGNLIATWDSNSLTLPLEDISSMQFSTEPASVEKILVDVKIEVYGLDGVYYGLFENLKKACIELSEGIYIAKTEDGITSKFVVK